MNYPLQALINAGIIPSVSFPTDSRYYRSATLQYTAPNGQTITYLARRLVPQPGAANFAIVANHTVKQGDRLDLVAAKYLGDPLMFWLHLRRERRHPARAVSRHAGRGSQDHHAARRPRGRNCSIASNSAF